MLRESVMTTVVHPEWGADQRFTDLYSDHHPSLVRLASVLVRDHPTAEEIVQDTFVSMAGRSRQIRDSDKTLAYVRQAIVNRSRSVLRHRIVEDKHLEKQSPDMPSAEHGALIELERSAVVSALRDLTDRQRYAIVLRYYAGLSEGEIATAMGISRGAVKSHTARAMAVLRVALATELSNQRENHCRYEKKGLKVLSDEITPPRPGPLVGGLCRSNGPERADPLHGVTGVIVFVGLRA